MMAVRWHLLLVARGRREPGLWWLFETYVIALLLGQVLPTAVGGDAVRAIDLARRTGARAEAVSSVVVDRVVGLAALGALAAVGALAGGSGIGRGTAVALGLGVVAVTAAAALALFSQRLQPLLRRLAPLAARLRVEAAALALPRAARLSLASSHAGVGLRPRRARAGPARRVDRLPGEGMGLDLSYATLLVLCPVLFLVTIVPASLNGIGLREATFVVVLGGAGMSREDAFALGLAYFAVGVTRWARRSCAAAAQRRTRPRQDWRVASSNVKLHAPSRARSRDALRGRGGGALQRGAAPPRRRPARSQSPPRQAVPRA